MIPTAFDKTLAPEGHHIMSLFTQWVPSTWSEEPHREELEKYADRVIDTYNEVAPNFKAAILHRDVVGPYEMEHDYGLIGGNIFHGELSLEQLFHLRPAPGFADYRTPVRGLYYASSATHAGGGVCGIPGMQAAKAAISDRRKRRAVADPVLASPNGCGRSRSARGHARGAVGRARRRVAAAGQPRRADDRGGREVIRAPAGLPGQSPVRRDRRCALLPGPR